MANRIQLQALQNQYSNWGFGFNGTNTPGGYDAGKVNRTAPNYAQRQSENGIPREQLLNLRARSWNLYRNNPHARKIVRSLEAKVIGKRGMNPIPQALTTGGKPHAAFRDRAKKIWQRFAKSCDHRGRVGYGGQSMAGLQRTALRGVILSGSTFINQKAVTRRQADQLDLVAPLQLQLIHRERLDESIVDANVFFGIETDPNDRRQAYHFYDRHPGDARFQSKTQRFPAKSIIHLYVEEDVDQMDGVPWFSAALLKMRKVDDYEHHELMAAAAASCIVAGFKRSSGQTGGLSVPGAGGQRGLTDGSGNPISYLQPGMLIDLGMDGGLEAFDPKRPTAHLPQFVGHMVRSEAAAVPGVKGSTLTQDYTRASFASEKSADNDVWPEIEAVQDWFATSSLQPVYETLITAAVLYGMFDDVEDFSVNDFVQRPEDFLEAKWQGPVARGINPVQDAQASQERIKGGVSSPQRECQLLGNDMFEIFDEVSEAYQAAKSRGLPDDLILQYLGIEQKDHQADEPREANETEDGRQDEGGIEESNYDDDTVLV